MPRKNSVKVFVPGNYYHLYNRGVAKQSIFLDQQDYSVFLRFIKEYLLPANHPHLIHLKEINPRRKPINCNDDVLLLAYCLMPNHFHLLVKLLTLTGMSKFIRAVATNYSMYFNHKYDRVGPLYQGIYKGVVIENEPQLLNVGKYIHRNPLSKHTRVQPLYTLSDYPYSSYPNYLNKIKQDWINTKIISSYFSKTNPRLTYKSFVEELETDPSIISDLTLEPIEE